MKDMKKRLAYIVVYIILSVVAFSVPFSSYMPDLIDNNCNSYCKIPESSGTHNVTLLNEDFSSGLSEWTSTDHTYEASRWTTVNLTENIIIDGSLEDWKYPYDLGTIRRYGYNSTAEYAVDGENLYISLTNNSLDGDGDFFVYLDTLEDQGSDITDNWNSGNQHELPFSADYYLGIEDGTYNRLFQWDGNEWLENTTLSVFAGTSSNNITEVEIPWSNLNRTQNQTARFVAFTQWDDSDVMDRVFPVENEIEAPGSSQGVQKLNHSATASPIFGNAYSPLNMSGVYGNDFDETLVLKDVNLTEAISPYLRIKHHLELADTGDMVSISVDGTEQWSSTENTYFWEDQEIDLTNYVGDTIDIEFFFFSNGANAENATGWRIGGVWVQELDSEIREEIKYFDIEDASDWTTEDYSGTGDYWGTTTLSHRSGTQSLFIDVDSSYDNLENAIISSWIHLPKSYSNIELSFWQNMTSGTDYAQTYMGKDGDWTQIGSEWNHDTSNSFEEVTCSLDDFKGLSSRIRFLADAGPDADNWNWSVDDVNITGSRLIYKENQVQVFDAAGSSSDGIGHAKARTWLNYSGSEPGGNLWHLENEKVVNSDAKTGSYKNNMNNSLTYDGTLDLSTASEAWVSFDYRLEIEAADKATAEFSNNSGKGWQTKHELADTSGIWKSETFSVPEPALLNTFTLGFRLESDGSVVFEGLEIDNVTLIMELTGLEPTANAGTDLSIEQGETVFFDGSASQYNIQNYHWEFAYDGNTIQLSGENPSFTFCWPGEYTVTLTVTDDESMQDQDQMLLTVEERVTSTDHTPPAWNPQPTDQTIESGDKFSYDVNATDASGVCTYWLSGAENFQINSETGIITNITSLPVGEYEFYIHVNDTRGNTHTTEIVIEVISPSTSSSGRGLWSLLMIIIPIGAVVIATLSLFHQNRAETPDVNEP